MSLESAKAGDLIAYPVRMNHAPFDYTHKVVEVDRTTDTQVITKCGIRFNRSGKMIGTRRVGLAIPATPEMIAQFRQHSGESDVRNLTMNAKTTAERQREFRARKKAERHEEVRGIFAPKHLHDAIKAYAKSLQDKKPELTG